MNINFDSQSMSKIRDLEIIVSALVKKYGQCVVDYKDLVMIERLKIERIDDQIGERIIFTIRES